VIRVGIYGGRGYVARELARLIAVHPDAELAWWHSREAGTVEDVHRNLLGTQLQFIAGEGTPDADVVFLCTPVGVAMEVAPDLLRRGSKVVSMAADFRITDRSVFESIYGPHRSWELQKMAVYGIPELHRDAIRACDLVANPGCFSTAAILALAPLVQMPNVDADHLVVDGISGTSGAGATLDRSVHHPEMCSTVIPYNVVGHRHTYEMEEQLSLVARRSVCVHFTSHYGPFSRGILATCHAFADPLPTRDDLLDLYDAFYAEQPFVIVNRLSGSPQAAWHYESYPSVLDVASSNFCQIGMDVDPKRRRIVIFAAIDNMGKGACSAAVQNMNLMFRIDETAGISMRGLGI